MKQMQAGLRINTQAPATPVRRDKRRILHDGIGNALMTVGDLVGALVKPGDISFPTRARGRHQSIPCRQHRIPLGEMYAKFPMGWLLRAVSDIQRLRRPGLLGLDLGSSRKGSSILQVRVS